MLMMLAERLMLMMLAVGGNALSKLAATSRAADADDARIAQPCIFAACSNGQNG